MPPPCIVLFGFQNDYFQQDGALHSLVSWTSDRVKDNAVTLLKRVAPTNTLVVHIELAVPAGSAPAAEKNRHDTEARTAMALKPGSVGAQPIEEVKCYGPRVVPFQCTPGGNALDNPEFKKFVTEHGVTKIVVAGNMISGAVDVTCQAAAGLGFDVVVLSDTITARSDFERIYFVSSMMPRYVRLMNTDEMFAWMAQSQSSANGGGRGKRGALAKQGSDPASSDGSKADAKSDAGGGTTTTRGKRCECGSAVASFGLPGTGRAGMRWCRRCPTKPPEAVAPTLKRCECGRAFPIFGIAGEGQKAARWCKQCPTKPAHAVDVKHKRCECGRALPSYGLPGGTRAGARWCRHCPSKPLHAVDVVSKRCECARALPIFGLPGVGRAGARWCKQCPTRPSNAVDVQHKKCECGRAVPSFGLAGDGRAGARWCRHCPNKDKEAVDVKNKRCECGRAYPIYGVPGEQKKGSRYRWCKTCPNKPPDAIDMKNKRYELAQQRTEAIAKSRADWTAGGGGPTPNSKASGLVTALRAPSASELLAAGSLPPGFASTLATQLSQPISPSFAGMGASPFPAMSSQIASMAAMGSLSGTPFTASAQLPTLTTSLSGAFGGDLPPQELANQLNILHQLNSLSSEDLTSAQMITQLNHLSTLRHIGSHGGDNGDFAQMGGSLGGLLHQVSGDELMSSQITALQQLTGNSALDMFFGSAGMSGFGGTPQAGQVAAAAMAMQQQQLQRVVATQGTQPAAAATPAPAAGTAGGAGAGAAVVAADGTKAASAAAAAPPAAPALEGISQAKLHEEMAKLRAQQAMLQQHQMQRHMEEMQQRVVLQHQQVVDMQRKMQEQEEQLRRMQEFAGGGGGVSASTPATSAPAAPAAPTNLQMRGGPSVGSGGAFTPTMAAMLQAALAAYPNPIAAEGAGTGSKPELLNGAAAGGGKAAGAAAGAAEEEEVDAFLPKLKSLRTKVAAKATGAGAAAGGAGAEGAVTEEAKGEEEELEMSLELDLSTPTAALNTPTSTAFNKAPDAEPAEKATGKRTRRTSGGTTTRSELKRARAADVFSADQLNDLLAETPKDGQAVAARVFGSATE